LAAGTATASFIDSHEHRYAPSTNRLIILGRHHRNVAGPKSISLADGFWLPAGRFAAPRNDSI